MKILTSLLALSLVASSALAGPFGYRPSFRPPTHRPSTPRPSFAKPHVSPTAKQTPAPKPAAIVSKPTSTEAKPTATPKSERATDLGPLKPRTEARPDPTGYSGLTWRGNGFTPMPGIGFGYYPYPWLLWSHTPRTPLVYAPHQAATSTSSQDSAKTETSPFDPEAEPDLTPKAESPGENSVERTESREDSSRGGLPMWVFGLASAAAFVLMVLRLSRTARRQ